MSAQRTAWIALWCGVILWIQLNNYPGVEGWLILAFYVVGAVMAGRWAWGVGKRLMGRET